MRSAYFAPPKSRTVEASTTEGERVRGARSFGLRRVPLIWRLLAVNLVVVLGGALFVTNATRYLMPRTELTPLTHTVMVLAVLALAGLLTTAVARDALQPLRVMKEAIRRFHAGDRTARVRISPRADPEVAHLAAEVNALWDRLAADAATIEEKTQQAERLAAQVIEAQEDERRRVARELHDEAGQALTALIIGLERGLGAMPEVYAPNLAVQPRQMVSDLRDLAVQTLDELRRIALELRPSVLDDLGLTAALRQLGRSLEERTGLKVVVKSTMADESRRLPATVETALFRIGQEAITNAARHAQATEVEVRLRHTEGNVVLDVRDNGIGLPALSLAWDGEHQGLFGMRERARLLGGTLHVAPVSPRGTLVQATIPAPTEVAQA